jgi:hypothetical protein
MTAGVFVVTTALFVLLASYATADETLYRWKNERGNLVNSDRPPPAGVDYEVISIGSSMVRKVDADEGAVPLTVKPTPGNDFEQVDTTELKVEKNAPYCERAKDNLEQIGSHARIQMRNEQGEPHYLSAEEKAAQKEKAIAAIEAYCE